MLKYLAVTSVMREDISLEVTEDLISQKILMCILLTLI